MADRTWKDGIDLSTRKARKKFKMFLRNRYLCSNTESYCNKQMFYCPKRFECEYHYLARRKKWYSVPSNQRRLLAKLTRLYGEDEARKRLEDIIAFENKDWDVTPHMVFYVFKKTFSCCFLTERKQDSSK